MKLVNMNGKNDLEIEEVRQILKEIPVEYTEFVDKDNKLYPNDRGLLKAQGNKPYYIPTKEEILDIGVNGYLSGDEYIQRFQKYLIRKLGAMKDEAEFAGCIIWRLICGDCEMQSIFDVLDDLGLMVDSEKELHILIQKINDLWNNTRKLLNRGYTPNEMRHQEKAAYLNIPMTHNILNFDEAKRNKIYPNDPCPCGSGKKYKNCCRNKK